MTTNEIIEKIIIPLIAAFVGAVIGAILAFKYQRKMEIQRDKRGLMQMLMAYRSIGAVEIDWIKALNMIDIVYHDNKKIKELLRKYLFYLNDDNFATKEHQGVLVELLYEMGQSCGYKDLAQHDIRDSYNPKAINHIYGSIIDRFVNEAGASETPPPTKS